MRCERISRVTRPSPAPSSWTCSAPPASRVPSGVFTFEDLVEEAPKHTDTRERAIDISENVNKDVLLKSFMYEKKRLPIKQISVKFSITEKIIKRSKKFIISVVIILDKNLRNLKLWIRR